MLSIGEKMSLFRENRVINWHEHVWENGRGELNVESLERLVEYSYMTHMDVLVCSLPSLNPDTGPDIFIKYNDILYTAMQKYPKLIKGLAFVNPGYAKESVREIERCVKELGMIGVKLYNSYFISDPAVRPVIEKCIELDIPILEHAGKLNDNPSSQPFLSNGIHFAKVSLKYPEAVIIQAHVGGGGDWQWQLKTIADSPGIYVDISGSVCDEGIIEQTVRYLGADRVLFGTDGSIESSVGKMLDAKIPVEDKIRILGNNRFNRYIERGLQ